jgi:hypothetical protein
MAQFALDTQSLHIIIIAVQIIYSLYHIVRPFRQLTIILLRLKKHYDQLHLAKQDTVEAHTNLSKRMSHP